MKIKEAIKITDSFTKLKMPGLELQPPGLGGQNRFEAVEGKRQRLFDVLCPEG